MPRSMTGFGRAQDDGDGRLSCEIRSVNHRFLATKIRQPTLLQRFEPWIESCLRRSLKRGSVEVSVQLVGSTRVSVSRLAPSAADEYLQQFQSYLRKHELDEKISPEFLFGLPGVLVPPDPSRFASTLGPRLKKVVGEALDELVEMREREGARLQKVLLRESRAVIGAVKAVRKRVPRLLTESQKRLEDRLAALLANTRVQLDEATVAREVAVLADRSDVAEELDRLEGHVSEFVDTLDRPGPVGRALDFVVQEIGREVNTIGSKIQDKAATGRVLEAKGAVERLREQLQNLE